MQAHAYPVLDLFETKRRLEVPLFQRQYVWNLDEQWKPMWEDIARKFTDFLDARTDGPVHFLGAMVLDQKLTPSAKVDRRQIIDGQQRLTTLQIFLAAMRDFCRERKCEEVADECSTYLENKGMKADPTEAFKVWPTQLDRQQFQDVITACSRVRLEAIYPVTRRPFARHDDPRPRMVEAYCFFYDRFNEFFIDGDESGVVASDCPLLERVEKCFRALKSALQVVVMDLDPGDDPQVIFETLNARGVPLLPVDLLRNYIFLRVARDGDNQETLYREYWQRFDTDFWRQAVAQGRLMRPRSDLFIQHFLASKLTRDISMSHLFVEYKDWIQRSRPFTNVRNELATLAYQRDAFKRIIEPQPTDIVSHLATFLSCFETSTVFPLLLHLFDVGVDDTEWLAISSMIESYLLRRAVCGLTAKRYNQIFLALTKELKKNVDATVSDQIYLYLSRLRGDSGEWPSDANFLAAWSAQPIYNVLKPTPRLVYIFKRLNAACIDIKHEDITINTALTIEHIMPQAWQDHWPLRDVSRELHHDREAVVSLGNPLGEATERREHAINTIGNLTIITQKLNSTVQNGSWLIKKPALLESSLLPINQQLIKHEKWGEEEIKGRATHLFKLALKLWPSPNTDETAQNLSEIVTRKVVIPADSRAIALGNMSRSSNLAKGSERPVPVKRETENSGYWFFNVGARKNPKSTPRSWTDNRRFGFMSAAGDATFAKLLAKLKVGEHIYAWLNEHGYVGLGEVRSAAVPVTEFLCADGLALNQQLLEKTSIFRERDFNECEFAVGVTWVKTVDASHAVRSAWHSPATLCKLNQTATLDDLRLVFDS